MDFTHSEYRFNQLSLTVQIPQFDLLDPTMGDIEEWRKQVGIDPNRLNIAILISAAPNTSPRATVAFLKRETVCSGSLQRQVIDVIIGATDGSSERCFITITRRQLIRQSEIGCPVEGGGGHQISS